MKTNCLKQMMLVVFGFASMVFIMSSCSQDDEVQLGKEEQVAIYSDQEYITYLTEQLGISDKEIKVVDSVLVVQGDIIFSKKHLQDEIYQQKSLPKLKAHYKKQYLVTSITSIPVNISGIKYNGLLVLGWRDAAKKAVANWNSLSGRISFYIVDTPSSLVNGINITIGAVQDPFWAAQSNFPTSSGNPGNSIIINKNTWNNYGASTMEAVLTHEIGHAIGFWHTDVAQGTYIPTSCGMGSDNNSIMRSVIMNWNGFSVCDREAFNYLYKK